MTVECRDLGGLVLHDITRAELASMWQATFAGTQSQVTYGYSLTVLPRLRDNPEIAEISNRFDVMISDGRGIFWLANAAGERIREHFSLPDAVELALQMAARNGQRVYLLGATAEVNAEALRRLQLRGVQATGRDGYFDLAELDEICDGILTAESAIVLIGISSPKKEQIAEYLRPRLKGCVIIPCGGMIDVIAGLAKREPRLVQKLGATWLYRWIQEPIRLWQPLVVNGLYAAGWLAPLILIRKRVLSDRRFSLLAYLSRRRAATQ
jgi:N-acetylglucosaminyldiphosphoundecaprenol N-acetyl-beta-D-mannosaminyltransferase